MARPVWSCSVASLLAFEAAELYAAEEDTVPVWTDTWGVFELAGRDGAHFRAQERIDGPGWEVVRL